jgi:hypothetical protein
MIRTGWFALAVFVVVSLYSFAPRVVGQGDPTNLGFIGAYKVAPEKMDPSKLPIIGAWRINLQKSDPRIAPRFSPTSMNLFIAENGGIRQEVFSDYPPKVDTYKTVFDQRYRSFWYKLDGKNIYKDPQGPNGQGQTVAMWLADRNTLFRERATKGVVDEWVLYRVSPDGKTLVWTPFNADGDSGQNVWDRVEMPTRTN